MIIKSIISFRNLSKLQLGCLIVTLSCIFILRKIIAENIFQGLPQQPDGIVRIIHQSWTNADLPEFFSETPKSWRKCFPDWKYILWTDDDNRNLIKNYYPWFIHTYDEFKRPTYRVDSMRYFYMLHFGGIYADLDADCLRPFENLIANFSLVFGKMGNDDLFTENSFFYSKKVDPFWFDVIYDIMKNSHRKVKPEEMTGQLMLTRKLKEFIRKFHDNNRTKIYPSLFFDPFDYSDKTGTPSFCKDFNRMNSSERKECRNYYYKKGSFVVQYHTHFWS